MEHNIVARDIAHQQEMEKGSSWLLRRMKIARGQVIVAGHIGKSSIGPNDLVWHNDTNVNKNPDSETSKMQIVRCEAFRREVDRVEALRVSRDPCPKCGTRGDLPCKHRGPHNAY